MHIHNNADMMQSQGHASACRQLPQVFRALFMQHIHHISMRGKQDSVPRFG